MPPTADADFLAAALIGYQEKLKEITGRIAALRAELGQTKLATANVSTGAKPAGVKRVLSPAARKRIAAAQKKRWAAVRAAKAAAAKPAPAKKVAPPKPVAKKRVPPKRAARKVTARKAPVAQAAAAVAPAAAQTAGTE